MKNLNYSRIGVPILVIILVVGVIRNHNDDSYKEELTYEEYENSSRDKYLSFKENILKQLKGHLNLEGSNDWQQDYNSHLEVTSNQFEGPQVHIEKLVYNGTEYRQKDVFEDRNNYQGFTTFTIHNMIYDPDDRTTGKPDIVVTVVPPVPYSKKESKTVESILNRFDGGENKIAPYKTYFKEVYSIEDSSIIITNLKMDLWLTEFSVSIETDSWNNNKEDEDDGKKEIANQRHKPFDIVLKIFPNVSPWYVNTGEAFDKKADMAVGAVYCKGIRKWPEDDTEIGVVPREIGTALPLIKQDYYNDLNNIDGLLDASGDERTIWNKPLYAMISVPNIGSYKKLLGANRGDEKVTFNFIMPLLVRGSWDIRIPPSIVPKYEPVAPYRRSLANILLPKWGIGLFGKGLSILIYIAVAIMVGVSLFSRFLPI